MDSPTRRIVGLMSFAVIFSVVGEEIKAVNTADKSGAQSAVFSTPAKIILGGTVAAALLSLAAETGDSAAQWAQGLALVATFTALFVNGAPVWQGLNNLLGSTPTTPTAITEPSTTPTGAMSR